VRQCNRGESDSLAAALTGVVARHVREKQKRGVSVPLAARASIALAVHRGGTTYREIGEQYGVSASTVGRYARAAQRVVQRRQRWTTDELRREVTTALREQKRGGQRRVPTLCAVRHGPCVRKMYAERSTLYLSEVKEELGRRFGRSNGQPGAVSLPTLCRFVKHKLGLARRRICGRPLHRAGVTGENLRRRREFVAEWFGSSANRRCVGTRDELDDQRGWTMAKEGVVPEQVFFEDETGVNRHTLRRNYGRGARRGADPVAPVVDAPRGQHHSVLIGMSSSGIVAHTTQVKGRGHGTKGAEFAHFIETLLGPAMLESARQAGLPPRSTLYLVMDNASIHHTKEVQAAAARVSSRIVLTFLPPYASTMNPVELLNSDLKAALRRREATGGATLSNLINRCIREDLGDTERYTGYYHHCGWH